MSPHVNGFVNDLVAMAKAMEELPQVQRELDDAKAEIERHRQHVQGLEMNIAGYKADIEGLNSRIHSLTEDKDNAEFRFLELEEKHAQLAKAVQGIGSLVGMVDKPEPAVVEHEPMPVDGAGQSVPDPTGAATPNSGVTQQAETSGAHSVANTSTEAPAVAPLPDPTAPSTAGDGHLSADAQSAKGGESASTSDDTRFKGRNWTTVPQAERPYTQSEWIKGGGDQYGWDN